MTLVLAAQLRDPSALDHFPLVESSKACSFNTNWRSNSLVELNNYQNVHLQSS